MTGPLKRFAGGIRDSISKKLFLSYLLVILLPLVLIGAILYVTMLTFTERQTLDKRAVEMKLVSQQLQAYIDQLELYSRVIYTGEVQALLNAGPPEDRIAYTRWRSALFQHFEEWYGYMNIKAAIQNVTIVRANGAAVAKEQIYAPEADFAREDWYRDAISRQGEVVIAGPFVRPYAVPPADAPHTFSLVRKINNPLGGGDLGGIVIDISVLDLERLLTSLGLRSTTIINSRHEVVYADRTETIGQPYSLGGNIAVGQSRWVELEGTPMFVHTGELPAAGWRFVSLDPLSALSAYAVAFRNLTIGVGLAALLAALVISTFIAGRITKPLRKLQQNMSQVEGGRFDMRLDEARTDEVGQLTRSFNQMTERIQSLVNDVYKAEIIRKEAQLKALHSQINPHFLYNTLDSMNAIAMLEDVPLLSRMSKMLADMFRYSISQGDQIVELRQELEQVKRYVEIQQIRYDYRFQLILSVPEPLLAYRIPKLTLQPIVENAVYHGLEMIPDEGLLAIIVHASASEVTIEVFDNGRGIPAEQLETIRQKLREPIDYADHLGLANVQERLQLHYGEAYGITIDSLYGRGTSVVYRLPPV